MGVVAAVVRAGWLALDSMLVAPTVVFLSPSPRQISEKTQLDL
jgi:hypothetical protein